MQCNAMQCNAMQCNAMQGRAGQIKGHVLISEFRSILEVRKNENYSDK